MGKVTHFTCENCETDWTDDVYLKMTECPYCGGIDTLTMEKIRIKQVNEKKKKKKKK